MGYSRVRYTGGEVNIDRIVFGQRRATTIAALLNIDPFVIGTGIAVVNPQERSNLHLVVGFAPLLIAFGGHENDLPGRPAQLVAGSIQTLPCK